MTTMTFFRWASFSLLGHIALTESFFSVPLYLVFLDANYRDGTLSLAWALYIALISALLGVVAAALIWYTISLPLIKRQHGK
jgi:hypothetical protein